MSIFVFQLFNSNDKDYNVVSGGKYDVVIRSKRKENNAKKMMTCPSWSEFELINLSSSSLLIA
jgi:gentisate 1,2-dioxygenase